MRRALFACLLLIAEPLIAQPLTLLSFNICFLPGTYPLQYGGVAPGIERVAAVADFILAADVDLVAIQEAHDHRATTALVQQLKMTYPYIVLPVESGEILNSGLLIASKYPIVDSSFKAFDYEGMQWQINKGFVSLKVQTEGGRTLAHIFVTHLQPGKEVRDRTIRELELREVTAALKVERGKGDSYPYILIGDLNIPWGSDEYVNSSLATFFDNSYTEGVTHITLDTLTATDYLTDYIQGGVDKQLLELVLSNQGGSSNPYREILDYIVLYQGDRRRYHLTVERIAAFSFEWPMDALSDHNALKATVH